MQADQAQGQGIGSLGPRTEQIEEVGVESLRGGGRIGLYQGGGPHSSPATEAYSSMGETDKSALMRNINYLMSEHGLSREEALNRVTSEFRKPLSPSEDIRQPQEFSRELLPPPRSLLGMRPQPVEDFREEQIGIETLRGRP